MSLGTIASTLGPGTCVFCAFLSYIIYNLVIGLYNITLHPLAKMPGPKARGAFYFPYYLEVWTGDLVSNWNLLHDEYGEIVRISPTTILFNSAGAWQDIYGARKGSLPLPKDTSFFSKPNDGITDIVTANDADHSRMRKLLSHAFSEGALREQESLLNAHFDLLIAKLHQKVVGSEQGQVNIVHWFNFVTFDIISDLCFGECFDSLRTEEYDAWISNIFRFIKFSRLISVMRAYPLVGVPGLYLLSKFPSLQKSRQKHRQYADDKTSRRLDTTTHKKDILSYVLRHNDERGMTREEIMRASSVLIVAGSETTASVLCGAIFHLLKNPCCMEKLTAEIRGKFLDASKMTFHQLGTLKYLDACVQEAFRAYPPVPGIRPRRTLPGGVYIDGHFIPGNVSVGISQWSANHSSDNFSDPDKYIPERWMDDRRFEADNRSAVQPFSVGPRNCVAQRLAIAETKGILARVLWHFDMSLCRESKNWDRQRVFVLFEKPELMVKLRTRE